MSREHDAFTERLAQEQDRSLDARRIEASVRQRLVTGERPRARRSERGLVVGGVALGLVAMAAAAVAVVGLGGPRELTARSGDRALRVGEWIDASEHSARIVFSDGTVVTLAEGASARLSAIDEHGARLVLERGSVDLDVVHTGDASWGLQAGPYTVAVTGTAFETTWEPERETFRVQMRAGSVFVTGPTLGDGQRVAGTSELLVDMALSRGQLTLAEPVEGPAEVVADDVEPVAEHQPRSPAPVRPSAPVEGEADAPEDWFAAYTARDYRHAIELAQWQGIDGILSGDEVACLYALGDAAKLAGQADLEVQAWTSLRARFAGTEAAATAALDLGRAAEKSGDLAAAAGWYRTAHDDGSNPTTRALALGMHMDALDKSGDAKAARQAAIEYLEKYPTGHHASAAKRLAPRKL